MITGDGTDAQELDAIVRALAGGVDLFQVRRRRSTARELERFVATCLDRVPEARDRLLVNDRLDVALAAGVSGVHLPARGLPIAAVRRRAPADFRIGVSTHRPEEVLRAEEDGASFAVFGPVFSTPSKPGHPGLGLEALARAAGLASIPVFALGGVGPENLDEVLGAGASGVAGISAFADEEALRALLTKLRRPSIPGEAP